MNTLRWIALSAFLGLLVVGLTTASSPGRAQEPATPQPPAPSVTVVAIGKPELLAKGAQVVVPITFTCRGFDNIVEPSFANAEIQQRVNRQVINRGSGFASFTQETGFPTCDGSEQMVEVTVTPWGNPNQGGPGAVAFKHGEAVVRGAVFIRGMQTTGEFVEASDALEVITRIS